MRSLVDAGRAEERVAVGPAAFVFSLVVHDGPPSLALEGSGLVARIPAGDARSWAGGDGVGLRYELPEGSRLLVEKDWACLEPEDGETNADTFARPGDAAAPCGASPDLALPLA